VWCVVPMALTPVGTGTFMTASCSARAQVLLISVGGAWGGLQCFCAFISHIPASCFTLPTAEPQLGCQSLLERFRIRLRLGVKHSDDIRHPHVHCGGCLLRQVRLSGAGNWRAPCCVSVVRLVAIALSCRGTQI
jgi:hypothetical protein